MTTPTRHPSTVEYVEHDSDGFTRLHLDCGHTATTTFGHVWSRGDRLTHCARCETFTVALTHEEANAIRAALRLHAASWRNSPPVGNPIDEARATLLDALEADLYAAEKAAHAASRTARQRTTLTLRPWR